MSALLVGYARCSTDQQDVTAQRDALVGLGVGPSGSTSTTASPAPTEGHFDSTTPAGEQGLRSPQTALDAGMIIDQAKARSLPGTESVPQILDRRGHARSRHATMRSTAVSGSRSGSKPMTCGGGGQTAPG
jgi:hypothetical protein